MTKKQIIAYSFPVSLIKCPKFWSSKFSLLYHPDFICARTCMPDVRFLFFMVMKIQST